MAFSIPIANQYFHQVGGTAENSGTVTPVGGKTAYRIDGQIPVTYATGTVKEAASILILPNRHGHVVLVEVAVHDNEAGRTTIDDVLSSVRLTAA